MNKYDHPPIVLKSDPRQVFETVDAGKMLEAHIETAEARFIVFMQGDAGWVLRDYVAALDYPFLTKAAAIGGMEKRLEGCDLLGSPIQVNAYGEPLEAIEVFA